MKLIDWLKERKANCERIAAEKTGADRAGWLEDGKYFNLAIAALVHRNDSHDTLVERSVLAMSYAEDDPELWEHVQPDCPMLEAVWQLRRRADSEYALRTKLEAELNQLNGCYQIDPAFTIGETGHVTVKQDGILKAIRDALTLSPVCELRIIEVLANGEVKILMRDGRTLTVHPIQPAQNELDWWKPLRAT